MKQLLDIMLDPLRSSNTAERLIVALSLLMVAFGFLVIAVDEMVVYVMSLLLLLCIARLIGEIREGENGNA